MAMPVSSYEEISWMDHPGVKCKRLTEFFYPNTPSSEVALAKAACNGVEFGSVCPMREQCLQHAINYHEDFGVWGGMSERDRRKIHRMRNKRKRQKLEYKHIYTLEDVKFPGVVYIRKRHIVVRARLVLVKNG